MTTVDPKNGPLCIHYHGDGDPTAVPDAHTLAIVSYGESSSVDQLDHRRLTVGLPVLHGNQLHEVWQSDQPVETGWLGDISYRCTGRLLFGQVLLDDSNYAGMEGLTRHIYQQIMALQTSMEFPHLLRIWNYFPWINRDAEGLERYRAFCVGRHQAIDTSSGYERHLPSASAIGTRGDKTLVYFLASRKPGNQIENPRQISAFDYPDQYSPKSPAFSRAMLVQWDPGIQLYISGTASIIGHQTYHRHDYIRQLGECLNNIDTLVTRARNENGLNIHSCADLTSIKIYLRHPEYLEHAMHYVNDRLGTGAPVVYLRGDICRSDLLLEVEGLYSSC